MLLAGVGLIGGSLALAARRAGLVGEVIGLGRTRQNLEVALERGIIDGAADDRSSAARGADLVVLAVPVAATARLAAELRPSIGANAVVTDVGSVKARVVREVTAALEGTGHFVGAHPIAGTADSGAAAAQENLFRGARCILTPTEDTDGEALAQVRGLWEGVGALVEELRPERHDQVLAWVSHAPHYLAYALMGAAPVEVHAYAGPSFRDLTRVAGSAAEMWRDISLYNAAAIEEVLESVLARLEDLREALRLGDAEALTRLFDEARRARRALETPA